MIEMKEKAVENFISIKGNFTEVERITVESVKTG